MGKMRRLGKGLEALIAIPEEDSGGEVQELPLHRIELNPKQPRQEMELDALRGLADSIRHSGVIQPLVVRPKGDMYELAVGERRLRAAKMAGLSAVPAMIRDLSDEQMLEVALVENLQREDLNPIEKATAIRRIIEEVHVTQEEVGGRIGLRRPTVTNFLRLLELSQDIQHMVSRGTISAGHARALLMLSDEEARRRLAKRIAAEGLSVREAERLASNGAAGSSAARPAATANSPNIERLERDLQEILCAKVCIKARGRKGKIIIHFNGHEDFERIVERITSGPQTELKRLSA